MNLTSRPSILKLTSKVIQINRQLKLGIQHGSWIKGKYVENKFITHVKYLNHD